MSEVKPLVRRRQSRWGEGDQLRAEILSAARRILEREGVESSVTLRGVAREVGITAPSIYAHFANREQLIEDVVHSVAADAKQTLRKALAGAAEDASPRSLLRTYCEAYIDFAHRLPAGYQILFVRPNPSALPSVRRSMAEVRRSFEALFSAAVPGLERREIRLRTSLAWAALHGLATLPPHHPHYPWPTQGALVEEWLVLHVGEELVRSR